MNTTILVEAGLTEAQANAYDYLARYNPISPPALSNLINESRTNTYKVLEQLEQIGLAQIDTSDKKMKYWAKNPSSLLKFVKDKQEQAHLQVKKLESSMPHLINEFMESNEQPGVKFYQGLAGIKSMYAEQLKSGENITMVRSLKDITFFGSFDEMSSIREKFNSSSISRHMITPDSAESTINWKDHDIKSGNTRTWLRASDYTASVEWSCYGRNLAITSFGDEAVGLIIESQQIADAFIQLLTLAEKGSRLSKGYNSLPTLASNEK